VIAMPRFTDRVPYYGLVDWDRQQITAYAKDLVAEHRPRRCGWRRDQRCCACGTKWPCFAAAWANGTIRTGP
jgi:hypothetical protein